MTQFAITARYVLTSTCAGVFVNTTHLTIMTNSVTLKTPRYRYALLAPGKTFTNYITHFYRLAHILFNSIFNLSHFFFKSLEF